MAKFVFVYRGGAGMEATAEAQQKTMAAWGAWYGKLGQAVVDGGAPFGASTSVSSSGRGGAGAGSGLGGFTIVSAESLDAAAALTDGCPVLAQGGTVDVYDCIDMGM
jgi:hypothetical protein